MKELSEKGQAEVKKAATDLHEQPDDDGISWAAVTDTEGKPGVQVRELGFWVKGWLWVPKEAVGNTGVEA